MRTRDDLFRPSLTQQRLLLRDWLSSSGGKCPSVLNQCLQMQRVCVCVCAGLYEEIVPGPPGPPVPLWSRGEVGRCPRPPSVPLCRFPEASRVCEHTLCCSRGSDALCFFCVTPRSHALLKRNQQTDPTPHSSSGARPSVRLVPRSASQLLSIPLHSSSLQRHNTTNMTCTNKMSH